MNQALKVRKKANCKKSSCQKKSPTGNLAFGLDRLLSPSVEGGNRIQRTPTISKGATASIQRSTIDDLLEKLDYFDIPESEVISLVAQLDQSEAISFMANTHAKERMMAGLDNEEMFRAMRDIRFAPLHGRLRWMLDEGTSGEYLITVILQRPSSELAAVLADSDMMDELRDILNYERELNGVDTQMDIARQLIERQSVCGPDITSELYDAVGLAETMFNGWTSDEKDDRCHALVSLETGGIAWDIDQLYNRNHSWILGYRPACATAQNHSAASGADELCGNTVEVNNQCFYAGSPNYIIFGKMMKLCHSHEESKSWYSRNLAAYNRQRVEALVDLYKGPSIIRGFSASNNYEASKAFSLAGFDGSRSVPIGDRPGCFPGCTSPYADGAFTVRWSSYDTDREAGREEMRNLNR